MARRGVRITNGEACRTTDGENGGGTHFAYGYLLDKQKDGTVSVRREGVSLGRMSPSIEYPTALSMQILERLSRKTQTSIGFDRLAAVVVTRQCWNEEHGLPMNNPSRVERVASLVIANTIQDVAEFGELRSSRSPRTGVVTVQTKDGGGDVDRPVIYAALTTNEEADYPISHLAFMDWHNDNLPMAYMALHDKLADGVQILVNPDELR